ncbi:LOW QUALITY PROTEIN: hypothetical protein PHMEG_00025215 [Phytophthora megakarya]|uniref:Uncharacterized protein n=1 Tax=Phytophthora megakarya TaxID=4795 RepID=A0A225VCK3_9STRA|nr:LOW QUALITY PROTEIN: hypothetical protein PHMEG_00025215 [Phytophthora megakarya]
MNCAASSFAWSQTSRKEENGSGGARTAILESPYVHVVKREGISYIYRMRFSTFQKLLCIVAPY